MSDRERSTPIGATDIVCGMGGDAVVALRAADRKRTILAANIDLDAVLLFVILGRGSHGEGGNWLVETGKVAASFLIGLVVAWLVARAWRAPWAPRTGWIVMATTVAVGMLLRPVFGRSVQVSFVIVAVAFLTLFLVGWRLLAGFLLLRRRQAT